MLIFTQFKTENRLRVEMSSVWIWTFGSRAASNIAFHREKLETKIVANITISKYRNFSWYNYYSKYVLSTMGVSKESISKFLIGNRFHVKLRILSPENCKQSLRVKSWKAEVTAKKKQNSRLQSKFRNTSS